MQNDVDILYYIAAYYNPNNLLPTQSVQVCPQQPPPPSPASLSMANIYAVAGLPHSPKGQEECREGGG